MKRWQVWLIYFIIVVSTSGFAFYQYKKSKTEKLVKEKENLVFPSLEPSQVQAVSIQKGNVDIRMFRQDGGWRMSSPVTDIADGDLVGDWLESLFSETVRVIKSAGANWEEYGLDQDLSFVEITTVSDKKVSLNISRYSAFDGSFYIRKGSALLLGGTSWASLVEKKRDYFRSYKLFNIAEHPLTLNYNSKSFKAHLKWDNHGWQWETENSVFPLSHSQLESYWSSLSNISFEKVPYPDTKSFRAKFKLSEPAFEIRMEFKNNKSWSVKISPEIDGKVYALVSTRNHIFILRPDQKERILLTEQKIRDHRQPFQFNKNQVQAVELNGYGLNIHVKKEKNQWKLLKSEVDHDKVNTMIKSAGSLETKAAKPEQRKKWILDTEELEIVLNKITVLFAKQYFGKEKSFEKTAHLILKDKEEKEILKLELSDPFEFKTEKKDEDWQKIYVKSSLGQETMALNFQDMKSVFSSDLLKRDVKENKKQDTKEDKK